MNIILLRGLARQAGHWGDFPDDLKQNTKVKNVFCLDLPGFGNQSSLTFPLKVKKTTALLQKQFKELGLDSNLDCHLVSISLGGMLGLEWASRHPDQFRTLTTINSSLSKSSHLFERLQPKAIQRILKIFTLKSLYKKEEQVFKMTSSLKLNQKTIEKWVELENKNPLKFKNLLNQLLFSSRYPGPKKMNTPLLVLNSSGDQMVSPKCSEAIAQKYNGNLKTHPTAGHDLPMDAPDWVIEQILNFIN